MLQVSGRDEEFTGCSSIRLDITWPVMNSIYIADGIPDCKSKDPCHSDADEHRFFWENTPCKPGPES
jgi:hypothetical protein